MIRLAPAAISDLQRLREFLYPENPRAAQRAMLAIWRKIALLEQFPELGYRTRSPDVRQTRVNFGKRGYTVRYSHKNATILVLRIWHGREDRNKPS